MFDSGSSEVAGAGSYASRHPLAVALEASPPSAGLVARLDVLDVADVDDVAVLEVIAAWERAAAWVAARQAVAVAELARRAAGSSVDGVPDEIATRLGTTYRAGKSFVTLAMCLETHPRVADALANGVLSARKAAVLLSDTEHLPDLLAARILDEVLPAAEGRTVPQLRADLRAAEIAVAPEAAVVRHREARSDRCVRIVPAPDAMAWLHALLPADDAQVVMTGLDAAAARLPEDERTADQRRADTLASWARRVLDTGLGLDGTPISVRQHKRPHLEVTVSERTLATGLGAAHLAGYGLVPFEAVRSLVADATVSAVLVDEEGARRIGILPDSIVRDGRLRDGVVLDGRLSETIEGQGRRQADPPVVSYRPSAVLAREVVDRDRTCRFPGCRVPAVRCDLDHVVPFDEARPASVQTTSENLQALCRHHHRLKTHGRWSVSRDPVSGTALWISRMGRVHLVSAERASPDPEPPRRREPAAWLHAAQSGALN